MKQETINVATLADGEIVEIVGRQLPGIRWVKESEGQARVDDLPPLTYNQFSYAGRSFSIDSNDIESVKLLKDKANLAKNVYLVTLEASSFEVDATDEEGNVIEGEKATRKSWRFVSLLTVENAEGFAHAEGKISAIQQKYAPKLDLREAMAIVKTAKAELAKVEA